MRDVRKKTSCDSRSKKHLTFAIQHEKSLFLWFLVILGPLKMCDNTVVVFRRYSSTELFLRGPKVAKSHRNDKKIQHILKRPIFGVQTARTCFWHAQWPSLPFSQTLHYSHCVYSPMAAFQGAPKRMKCQKWPKAIDLTKNNFHIDAHP